MRLPVHLRRFAFVATKKAEFSPSTVASTIEATFAMFSVDATSADATSADASPAGPSLADTTSAGASSADPSSPDATSADASPADTTSAGASSADPTSADAFPVRPEVARFVSELEALIQQDPGNRGIGRILVKGELLKSASSLASAKSVLILTGFPCHYASSVPEENDGPPGALLLASTLLSARKSVSVCVDRRAAPTLRGAADAAFAAGVLPFSVPVGHFGAGFQMRFDDDGEDDDDDDDDDEDDDDDVGLKTTSTAPNTTMMETSTSTMKPKMAASTQATTAASMTTTTTTTAASITTAASTTTTTPSTSSRPDARFPSVGRRFDHVVAVERVGRAKDGRHYTMRGVCVSHLVDAGIDDFFLAASKSADVKTTGIGDGGNELGTGAVWQATSKHVARGSEIGCVIAADFTIFAGVSNWGAYATAFAVAAILRGGEKDEIREINGEKEAKCGEKDAKSGEKVTKSGEKDTKSGENDAKSGEKDEKCGEKLFLPSADREGALLDILTGFGFAAGVSGAFDRGVDGLSWEEIHKPLLEKIARMYGQIDAAASQLDRGGDGLSWEEIHKPILEKIARMYGNIDAAASQPDRGGDAAGPQTLLGKMIRRLLDSSLGMD